jgi:hypothetical protein
MKRGSNEELRKELAEVVQATRDDVRHPWYLLRPASGRVPDEAVNEVVSIALRRWGSSKRRKGGRLDRVHDLGTGLYQHFGVLEGREQRDDFQFLARALAEVLEKEETPGS